MSARPGDTAKRDGMERARKHANPEWHQAALEALKFVAEQRQTFTSEAVMQVLRSSGAPPTHENRAYGPLMLEGVRLGWMIATDEWVKSRMRQNHSRPQMVWYSLIYRGDRPVRFRIKRRIHDPRQAALLEDAA